MADEIELQKQINRGAKAQGLLNNELLQEAFSALESGYIQAWRSTAAEDQVGREKLFLAINVVGKVRDHLTSTIQNGKVAQADMNRLFADAERKKRFGIL